MSRHHARLHKGRWERVRRQVLDRDGWRCTACGRYGNEVDHVIPLHVEPGQDPYAPVGCQTLCKTCHIEKTRAENRREPTPAERAWREFAAELAGS